MVYVDVCTHIQRLHTHTEGSREGGIHTGFSIKWGQGEAECRVTF